MTTKVFPWIKLFESLLCIAIFNGEIGNRLQIWLDNYYRGEGDSNDAMRRAEGRAHSEFGRIRARGGVNVSSAW